MLADEPTGSLDSDSANLIIDKIQSISKPGLRVYSSSKKMPRVLGGFGTAIVSTSRGLMTDRQARSKCIGGEILCYIW